MYFIKYYLIVTKWDEFGLFYSLPSYNITSKYIKTSSIYTLCPFNINMIKRIKKLKNITFTYIWCDLLVEMINEKEYSRKVGYYLSNDNSKEKNKYIYTLYYNIFNKLLIVNKRISDQVKYFHKRFINNQYIAIQIRVGNEDLKEDKRSTSDDITKMIYLAKRSNNYKKWFLTADSIKVKMNLSKLYNEIILYSYNKTKHFARNLKDSSIVIEHEILSRSKFQIISKSSYGLTALLKSGLLILKKNVCYEVKNGSIYNVKNEFDRFYD